MTKDRQVVSIHGVPRSGTTWLAQIFNSHPRVAFRFQPLFAYRFKDRLNLGSSRDEVNAFLDELWRCDDDDFIVNGHGVPKGFHPEFLKDPEPTHLVMKMVRYHHLVRKFFDDVAAIKVIGVVRNPMAVINSWLKAPTEFEPEWDPLAEWRYAPKKNQGRMEEFFGFEKWKEVATMFTALERDRPRDFILLRYENLVAGAEAEIERLFSSLGLEMHPQVLSFLEASQRKHVADPAAVFKNPSMLGNWQHELDSQIIEAIQADLRGTPLEVFLG